MSYLEAEPTLPRKWTVKKTLMIDRVVALAAAPPPGAPSRIKLRQIITPELLEILPRTLLFHGLVWLAEPKLSAGSIDTSATAESQIYSTHHGLLVKTGKLFYRAKTPGLDYTLEDPPRVGDWVSFQRHSGFRRQIKIDKNAPPTPANTIWLVTITDTDITECGDYEAIHERLVGWL
jgi:hypothetical protein